jgi:hypothetical protein
MTHVNSVTFVVHAGICKINVFFGPVTIGHKSARLKSAALDNLAGDAMFPAKV